MKKTDFSDGICGNCGNSGLAGDKCIVCGEVMSKIDEGLVDPVAHGDDNEVYPLEMVDKEESGENDLSV